MPSGLGGGITRVSPTGDIETLATPADIEDPVSVAFGTRGGEQLDLFIANFDFFTQQNPRVVKMHIGIPGKPLP